MPKSNWKGYISFGLVSIPISLINSENQSEKISFKQINLKTGAKIKYKRVDSVSEKEVPWDQIGKGYEIDKDTILPLTETELVKVAGENSHTIAIEEFVNKDSINFLNIEKTYYIIPDKKVSKGYAILQAGLEQTKKIGIAKVIISTKEYLSAVSTFEGVLVLHLLRYQDEIHDLADIDFLGETLKKNKITAKELEIAKKLILSMSAEWQADKYRDEYKVALEKWITAKSKNLPTAKMKNRSTHKDSKQTINFVDLLRKSLTSSKPMKKTIPKKLTSKPKVSTTKKTLSRKNLAH